jgi:hypothetical protein
MTITSAKDVLLFSQEFAGALVGNIGSGACNGKGMRPCASCFGNRGGAGEGPLLHAAILILLLCATVCHAQVTCPSSPTITSVTPSTWVAGQTYNITIAGTSFLGSTPSDPYCPAVTTSVTLTSSGSVTLSSVSIVSATKITASVTPAASDPSQMACVTVAYAVVIGVEPATVDSGSCPANSNKSASAPVQIENPEPSIATLKYTNSQPLWQDDPGTTPTPISNTVWTPSSSFPSVFVSGNKINATATFNVTPGTSALSGVRIEGSVKGLGLLVASGVTIPAGATSVKVNLTGDTPFPVSQTQHYQPLGVTWSFSPSGQTCSSSPSSCEPAGSTSSEVYVTLAAPSGLSENVMPLTAVKLAIGSGGATTRTDALKNTWQQFAGPANVEGWDGRPLFYYKQGVGFQGCATDSVGLLTEVTGSGQCASWARLLQDALAVNGIPSSIIQVIPSDGISWMLVKDWTFGTLDNLPYHPNLELPIEFGGGPGMVPLPPGPVFGDLISLPGVPGQNTSPPSEKVFIRHFIVQAPSSLGGGYYDPSYGVTYLNNCDFQEKAVAFYAIPVNMAGGTANFVVQLETSGCNITFTTFSTN